jgi:predicted transcriptional regulator
LEKRRQMRMSKLARHRRATGLTQHQLSRGADVPRWKITFAETGRIKLTADELQRIEQVLAARVKEIARMVDDPVERSARLRSASRGVDAQG